MASSKKLVNRLPPETQGKFTKCCICYQWTHNIHWHHTTPQALGGKDSLQIPIDGDCHTTLHAKADYTVSYLKGNQSEPPGRFWDKWESEQRAQPYLEILVSALLDPPVQGEDKRIKLGQPEVDLVTRELLNRLKQDLPGVTNIMQTLQYCINYTLKKEGYKNEKIDQQFSTSTRNKNRPSDVSWLRRTERRKSNRTRRK